MSDENRSYGGRLYAELRKLSGYNLIAGIMNYAAIQQLKVADRDDTVKLFRGSSDEVIHVLRTVEPEEAAQYLVAKAGELKNDDSSYVAAISLMIMSF